jgi:hypothetical protein
VVTEMEQKTVNLWIKELRLIGRQHEYITSDAFYTNDCRVDIALRPSLATQVHLQDSIFRKYQREVVDLGLKVVQVEELVEVL